MRYSSNKKLVASLTIMLILLISGAILAQEKPESKSKLDGKIEKITVKVDGKDVVYEGKEAEDLGKLLRAKSDNKMVFITSDGEEHFPGEARRFKFIAEDGDAKEIKKTVKVEQIDGKKKIIITTDKDGKVETKELEGEEAEAFWSDKEGGKEFNIKIDKDGNDENVMIFSSTPRHRGCCCCCCGGGNMHAPIHDKRIEKIIIEKEKSDSKSDDKKTEKSK